MKEQRIEKIDVNLNYIQKPSLN